MTAVVPAMQVDHVSRWYGNVVAVNDVSFALGSGVTGLLGPNGAGKSTLLHLLAGLLAPSAGTVRIGGRTAFGDPTVYTMVGLVPEREAVPGYLTGREFVRINAELQAVADVPSSTETAIATVEMSDAADRPIRTYSKGMRQRIKLAAALVHQPRILLLDEPFNGMDPRQRLHMMELLRRMAAEGRAILFSSHILEEVERLAEAVLVLYASRCLGRLPVDPSAHDRPAASVHHPLVRRSGTGCGPPRQPGGVRRRPARRPPGHPSQRPRHLRPDRRSRRSCRRHPPPRADADRRHARERLQLPGPPVRAFRAIVEVTLRALVGRRRTILIALLACLPIVLGILVRIGGGRPDAAEILDALVIRTVCPLVALIVGTGAIGSEIEDGTLVFQLVKPVPRWLTALAKGFVAAALTSLLIVPPIIVTGLLLGGLGPDSVQTSLGFAVAGLVGGSAYAIGFTALGVVTSRALIIGLGYTLIWEGAGRSPGRHAVPVRAAGHARHRFGIDGRGSRHRPARGRPVRGHLGDRDRRWAGRGFHRAAAIPAPNRRLIPVRAPAGGPPSRALDASRSAPLASG